MSTNRAESSEEQFTPDYTSPPGASLREVLTAHDMSQSDLSLRTGLSLKHINQIVQGLAPITQETSLALEKVTGVPAQVWNARESKYREHLARLREQVASPEDIAWLRSVPTRELVRRGFLKEGLDKPSLLQDIYRFFGVANRESWEKVWRSPLASFRRSPSFKSEAMPLASWLRVGELEAEKIVCQPFDAKAFRQTLQKVRALTRDNTREASMELVRLCAESGVAVVYVPEIKGARASGAAYWVSPIKAVIQLSDRYKKDDHFWFSFFHEAGHLLLHGKKDTYVSDGQADTLAEEEANQFAATTLVRREFERDLRKLQNSTEIAEFAERIGIAPGIVVGRLQNEGVLDWSQCNSLKRSVKIVEDEA